ncbi:unnamed protein product [Anisakis simplex]|uniref:Plexin-D1 (inferred by orthology to a human protein) n=1 Tax=Anisakis simplex TaxID=6269 RepID=A0A0M3KCZ7_ANISI|nr:unnamed protein product [Anisakis simplex]
MGSDCSTCLSLDQKWGCIWCDNACSHLSQCIAPSDQLVSHSADALCPKPFIESFEPKSGPLEGGTLVEIRGRELGISLQDIKDRVFIGGSKCDVLQYVVSKRIICSIMSGSGSSPVQLRFGNSGKRFADSESRFKFVDPQPKSIYPSYGPVSGGTKVVIYGTNLNVGSNMSVFVGEHRCQLLRDENEMNGALTCLTGRVHRPQVIASIRIQIDRAERILERKFEYREDPVIRSIYPTSAFESGGRLITVEGSNLDTIQKPKMYIASIDSNSNEELISSISDCQVSNSSSMLCRSPKINLPPSVSPSTYSRWPVGFLLDNVQSTLASLSSVQITIVPDPQFVPFKGIRIHRPDQLFLIEGNYLSHAASAEDYKIYIGSSRCKVTLLDKRQLMCRAPLKEPRATDEKGNEVEGGRPLLTVIIGSIRHELGFVEYESSALRLSLSRLLLLLIGGVLVCTIVTVLAFIMYRRKRDEREKDYKRIQLKMEYLEFNVRNECKQAFAELQTDVTDLTMAVEGYGIPFQDKSEFISRLLFKDIRPINTMLSTSSLYSSHSSVALAQFESLMNDKRFVYSIVEMIELDISFSIDEKRYISSLLISSLFPNFVYFTDVILSLIHIHISNAIQVLIFTSLFICFCFACKPLQRTNS